MAYNRLDAIYLDAFVDLPYLRALNLSWNNLQVFDNGILERNLRLETVDLSGNNFMYLDGASILKNSAVQVNKCSDDNGQTTESVLISTISSL